MKKGLLFIMFVAGVATSCREAVSDKIAGEYLGNIYTDNLFINSLPAMTTAIANGRDKVNISLMLPGVPDSVFQSINMVGVEITEPTNEHYALAKVQGNQKLTGSFYAGKLMYTYMKDSIQYNFVSGGVTLPDTSSSN